MRRGTRAGLVLGVLLAASVACGEGSSESNGDAASPAPTSAGATQGEPTPGDVSGEPTQGEPAPGAGSGESSGSNPGAPTATEGATPPGQPELESFLAACAQNVETWRPGQLTYTRRLSVPLHQARTYRAQVDIQPGAQDRPAPDANTGAAGVEVKCGVAARLVPLSDDVSVDSQEWVLRDFDQPAVVKWDWSVQAVTAHDSQVRLELRPAVADAEGRHIIPAAEDNSDLTMSGDTDVTVVATRFQRFYQWWDDNWGPLQTIVGALGVAVLALLTWMGKVRGWFSRTQAASAPEPPPPARKRPPTPRAPEPSGRKTASSGRGRGRPR